ncbi:recombinase family protein [Gracilibacillus saliphilus]|uniref:recombinase family protein n=1 Tax=Gracilibacillus saliphilus TaxID=543890 RepID=UPI001EE34453|nr:recombinase family protein [Gracilibacillus saliphilus]
MKRKQKVVQLIYHMYTDGKGLRAISNHLNKAGYMTKRRKGKNPNPILVERKHEAIISDE